MEREAIYRGPVRENLLWVVVFLLSSMEVLRSPEGRAEEFLGCGITLCLFKNEGQGTAWSPGRESAAGAALLPLLLQRARAGRCQQQHLAFQHALV